MRRKAIRVYEPKTTTTMALASFGARFVGDERRIARDRVSSVRTALMSIAALHNGFKPACLLGDPDRVHAIPGAELADGVGKIIAHRGRREVEKRSDFFGRASG